jgi:hypothetical protein
VTTVLRALVLLLAAQAQQSGTIAGRVTEQGSGRPLPRIVVTLVSADRSQIEEVTDADGQYRFSGLKPGKYAVAAGPDEHRSTHLRHWHGDPAPTFYFSSPRRFNVELTAGESKSTLDIALTRALAIEGRITSPWDEPMANVEVVVSGSDGRTSYARPAFSDHLGVYRVYGLAPGRHRVCASVREQPEVAAQDGSRLVKTCYPAAIQETLAGDVTLTTHDQTGIDIRVQRIGSHTIAGFVMDAAGVAVDGARVSAVPADESMQPPQTTTQGGAFVLKGVTPGRYVIQAAIGGSRPGDPNPPRREMEVGYAPIEVSGGDVAGVAIQLSKPAKVAGRIVFAGDIAPRGDRLRLVVQTRNVEVSARYEWRPPFAPVNDDLTFELGGLYPQRYLIRVQGVPDGWVLSAIRYQDRDITHVPTDFTDAARSPIHITLTNRIARLGVRVSDDQGVLLTGYGLVVVPADPATWQNAFAVVGEMPSADGVLKLGAWLPGDYVIAAVRNSDLMLLWRDRTRVTGLAAAGTRVTFQKDDTRTIDLRVVTLPDKR